MRNEPMVFFGMEVPCERARGCNLLFSSPLLGFLPPEHMAPASLCFDLLRFPSLCFASLWARTANLVLKTRQQQWMFVPAEAKKEPGTTPGLVTPSYLACSPSGASFFHPPFACLQCFLALRVGIMAKNFLVLLVATSYLWRPYLQRVQVRSIHICM